MIRRFLLLFVSVLLLWGPASSCSKPLEQTDQHWKSKEEDKKEEEQKKEDPTPSVYNPSDYPPAYPDLTNKCWTKRTVVDGIIYWEYEGYDKISSAYQSIHVADIDLSKDYKFIIGYDGEKHITSDMHKKKSAYVTINAGYETSSIFIKYLGTVMHNIENKTISGTSVPNWKNDGAVCISSTGAVSIVNSMCSLTGQTGVSRYGDGISDQRAFYRSSTDMVAMDNIISSGPLLIYEGQRWGETFVPSTMSSSALTALDSENPYRHQGVRHPRTAVALCSDGRLILFVVDGRSTGKREGFSAKELTQFLVANFNPVFALNMDGGGSTTMCIAGLGRETTHVVNNPCDTGDSGKANNGERSVRTFFCVVKK